MDQHSISASTPVDRRVMAYPSTPETPWGIRLNVGEHGQRQGWQWDALPDLKDLEAGVKLVTGFHQSRIELIRLLLCSNAEESMRVVDNTWVLRSGQAPKHMIARHQRLHAYAANLSSSQEVVPVTIIYDRIL